MLERNLPEKEKGVRCAGSSLSSSPPKKTQRRLVSLSLVLWRQTELNLASVERSQLTGHNHTTFFFYFGLVMRIINQFLFHPVWYETTTSKKSPSRFQKKAHKLKVFIIKLFNPFIIRLFNPYRRLMVRMSHTRICFFFICWKWIYYCLLLNTISYIR